MNKKPTFCRECERRLPKRAYRTACASCRKTAAGFVRVFVPIRVLPGLVTVYRQEWRRKAGAA